MKRVALAIVVAFAACGPVDRAPPLPAPLNVCPEHACADYKPFVSGGASASCNGGVCSVSTKLEYTLVVTLSSTSFFAPGQSFVIPRSQLFAGTSTTFCPTKLCSHLPGLGILNGQYFSDKKAQDDVGYFIAQVGAIPSRVMYRPLVAAPSAATLLEAEAAGMPLLPSLGDVAFPVLGYPGPGGGPNPGFRAVLPPGTYERTITPEPPYEAHFPPDVVTVTVGSGSQSVQAGSTQLKLDTHPGLLSAERPIFMEGKDADGREHHNPILRADGGSLDGWTAFIRDQPTLRRLSTLVPLGPSNRTPATTSISYNVTLDMNHHPPTSDALKDTELVLVPPADADATPTLVAPWLAGSLVVPPYPPIPAPVTVKGSVTVSTGSAPSSALLLFRSKKIYLTPTDPAGFTTNLVYEARATATSAGEGSDARYSVRLPRGEYDVVVIPSDGPAAKSVLGLIVNVDDRDPVDGKDFALKTKRGVLGVARASDGRPLAGATIVAAAASSLAAAGTPTERWPRLETTTTSPDGSFVLRLDPGTFDISVRPADGSRLPWVVVPARAILSADGDLVLTDPIDVPAPIAEGFALADPSDNPIVSALVRAFAVPTGGTAWVEIGRAITGNDGRYDLFLAGTPHP